jgi:hypothetical protein
MGGRAPVGGEQPNVKDSRPRAAAPGVWPPSSDGEAEAAAAAAASARFVSSSCWAREAVVKPGRASSCMGTLTSVGVAPDPAHPGSQRCGHPAELAEGGDAVAALALSTSPSCESKLASLSLIDWVLGRRLWKSASRSRPITVKATIMLSEVCGQTER